MIGTTTDPISRLGLIDLDLARPSCYIGSARDTSIAFPCIIVGASPFIVDFILFRRARTLSRRGLPQCPRRIGYRKNRSRMGRVVVGGGAQSPFNGVIDDVPPPLGLAVGVPTIDTRAESSSIYPKSASSDGDRLGFPLEHGVK